MVHSWTLDTRGRESADLGARVHYQIGNHLGSVTLELDASGAIISYEEYLPYGGSAFIAGDRIKEVDLKEYRYSGKIRDDATGLYYYGYRYYAVWIGNWLSADPAGAVDGLNLYRFVRNNPMRFVDPDGLDPFDSWGVTYDPETWTPEQVKAHYNASGGENFITGEVRLIGGRWVPTEFTQIPKQQSAEDHELVDGILDSFEEALSGSDLDIAGLAKQIGTGGQGDQGDGEGAETQEGQDGGQGEAQEGEATGETGTGDQSSKQGDPDGDPEGTDPESQATSSNTTATGEQPGTEERQGNTDPAVPPPPMGAPLSEDGQAFDPSKGFGGQGQAGERVSVGDGSDPGGVPPDEEKQGQEIERTWLDSAVEIAGYLNLEFGDGAPEGDRYGVPGGWLGWIPGSRVTQGIYVAVSTVMAVITVIELAVGIGEAKLAAKAGIAAIRTLGVKGAVKFFWDDALKKAASLGGMLLRRNKDEAAEGAEAAARIADFEDYIDDLPSKPTPSNTPQDLYEIAQTGPDNYLISGGGERTWADGLDATQQAALEAKRLVNPGRSPFIPGSAAPPFIRTKITGQVADEIRRYGSVIVDDSNPIRQLIVRVSDSRAVPFFEDLMTKLRVPGRVEVR
ncbi:MAG: RHS repeat-associated protein [Cognaticolwellia sp.]|jgi:RHS repeat-associated protein